MANKPNPQSLPAPVILAVLVILAIVILMLYFSHTGSAVQGHASGATTSIGSGAQGNISVTFGQELNNSAQQGLSLSATEFYSTSPNQCSLQLISACNNNVPQQFICVNSYYAQAVVFQYHSAHTGPAVCPQFVLGGHISCGIEGDYCIILDNRTAAPEQANSSG